MAWITPEIVATVGVGVTLAGLVIRGEHRLEDLLLAVENEQARISGLIKGLGITGRAVPAPEHGAD